mmetsp:Transcript_32424/g.60299  ORF Transcript_32424/g.60299 Transcript_32424/m.60299 type:complete len:225 (-) Transcript_32424:587-1261(-)
MNFPSPQITHAINRTELDLSQLTLDGLLLPDAQLSTGEVACSLSHREAMRKFLDNPDLETAVFFEDDAALNTKTFVATSLARGASNMSVFELLEDIAKTHETLGWDGVNLGRCWDNCDASVAGTVEGGLSIVDSCSSLCTHAYILTRKGAELYMKYTAPVRDAEDRIRAALSSDGLWKYFSLTPRLFEQDRDRIVGNMMHHPAHLPPECIGTRAKCSKWHVPGL